MCEGDVVERERESVWKKEGNGVTCLYCVCMCVCVCVCVCMVKGVKV